MQCDNLWVCVCVCVKILFLYEKKESDEYTTPKQTQTVVFSYKVFLYELN